MRLDGSTYIYTDGGPAKTISFAENRPDGSQAVTTLLKGNAKPGEIVKLDPPQGVQTQSPHSYVDIRALEAQNQTTARDVGPSGHQIASLKEILQMHGVDRGPSPPPGAHRLEASAPPPATQVRQSDYDNAGWQKISNNPLTFSAVDRSNPNIRHFNEITRTENGFDRIAWSKDVGHMGGEVDGADEARDRVTPASPRMAASLGVAWPLTPLRLD